MTTESNSCPLREDEGHKLSTEEKGKLNALLKKYERIFEPGFDATPYVKNHIITGDHHPVSSKKEELEKRITYTSVKDRNILLWSSTNGLSPVCVDKHRYALMELKPEADVDRKTACTKIEDKCHLFVMLWNNPLY
ncbi:hypothetical protein NPIL_600161 [Nephila pilipes]|uniref:Uncharacterized protein n=1 Tax=Nephila pilipes TaxID=299642 RepID=A0A8X6UCX7_NEPPI|nr:hypothetical protein NPIL_600161 [Nephila pilipes]